MASLTFASFDAKKVRCCLVNKMKKYSKPSKILYSVAVLLTCVISIWSFVIAPTIEDVSAAYKVDETVNKGFTSGNDLNHQFAVKDGDGYKNMTDLNEMSVGESMYVLVMNMSVDHSYKENQTGRNDDWGIPNDLKVTSNSYDYTKETYGNYVWYNYNPSKRFLTFPDQGGRAFVERLCADESDSLGRYGKVYSDLTKYVWKITCESVDSKGNKNFSFMCKSQYLARQNESAANFLFATISQNKDGDRTLWQLEKEDSLPTRNYFEEEVEEGFDDKVFAQNPANEKISEKELTSNKGFTKFYDNAYAIKSSVDFSGSTLSSYLFHRTYSEWPGNASTEAVGNKNELVHDAMVTHQDGSSLGNHQLNYYWLIFPLLQDVDKSATYGYSGAPSYQPISERANVSGITSTISSLYGIADGTRDARTGDNITCLNAKEGYGGNGIDHDKQYVSNALFIPEGTTSNNQLMKMNCGDENWNYMAWDISPTSNTGLRLDVCGDNTGKDKNDYTPRDGWASRDNTVGFWGKNLNVNQLFMFLYSLNSDGGYYILPMCLRADKDNPTYFNNAQGVKAWVFNTTYERDHYRIQDYGFRVLDYAKTDRELQIYDFFAASNQRFWIHCESQSYETFVLIDVAVDVEKVLQNGEYTYPSNRFGLPIIVDKAGNRIAEEEKLRKLLKNVISADAVLDAYGNMIETDATKIKENVIPKTDNNVVYKTIDVSINNLYYNSKFYEGTEKEGYTFIMDSVQDITNRDIMDNASFVKRVCIRFYRPNRYTAKYDANSGGGTAPRDTHHVYDHIYPGDVLDTKAFPKNTYTKSGYTFMGWNTKADGSGTTYQPNDDFYDSQPPVDVNINLSAKDNDIVTLYAIWSREEFRLVNRGQNVIAKNADAYNVSDQRFYNVSDQRLNKSKLTDFSNGALDSSYTYGNKSKAVFEVSIASTMGADYCWYVDSDDQKQGAKKLGVSSASGNSFNVDFKGTKITGNVKTLSTTSSSLEVSSPTKALDGIYFFCIIVAKENGNTFTFPNTIQKNSFNSALYLESNPCQLKIANNIIYHSVDKNGNNEKIITENGQAWEDWIVYGTCDAVVFPQDENYIQYSDYNSIVVADPNNPTQPLSYNLRTYSYDRVEGGDNSIGFDGWILFEDTVRNPVKNKNTFRDYKDAYAEHYGALKGTSKKYWRLYGAFSMDGEPSSKLHDTTLNLYTKWYIDFSTADININVFVDKFGTTFIADEESYANGNITFADKNSDGKNKYAKDTVYIVVSLNSGVASGGTIQYYHPQKGWIDLLGADSTIKDAIKGSYTDSAKLREIENWYSYNLGENCTPSYAVEFNTETLIKKLAGNNEVVCPSAQTSISFRYVYGTTSGNSWFEPLGVSECGEITFIPFNYSQLS